MSASKSFIKNAVGILIVVAVCFVAVTIYRKGNTSINHSLSDYDEIVSQFSNAGLHIYDNSTTSGSQIVNLLKTLKKGDGITVKVANGYSIQKGEDPQEYTYQVLYEDDSRVLKEIADKSKAAQYINPTARFISTLSYDENGELVSVLFEQR